MVFKECAGNVVWQCSKSACDQKRLSVRKDTWLEGSTIPLKKIIVFIYSWAKDYTAIIIIDFCIDDLGIRKDTAVDFNNYLREVRQCICKFLTKPCFFLFQVCAETMLKVKDPIIIGGENKTVEIDETYYSKRKY